MGAGDGDERDGGGDRRATTGDAVQAQVLAPSRPSHSQTHKRTEYFDYSREPPRARDPRRPERGNKAHNKK
jgi:hypothetical protein